MKKIICLFGLIALVWTAQAQSPSAKMDELLAAYHADNKFNGTVLVAHKGKVVFEKGYGYRNAETKQLHTPNSIFQVGSITKQFTAALVVQLAEEGKLSLQDKLSKYFPGFAHGDEITIEHLLTHTSGLFNYTNDTMVMKRDVTRHYSQGEIVTLIQKYPADFTPGTKWNYSNSGYMLLGYIIEKVTGTPYEAAMRQRILSPLGMARSGFDFTHLKDTAKTKGYFSIDPQNLQPAPIVDSTIAYSAGALYATTHDLYKWERGIANGKILKPASWQQVFTPYKSKYGYGWSIDTVYGKNFAAHSGGIHGFTSYILRFPQDDLVVIMLSNGSSPALAKMSRSLVAIVYDKPYDVPVIKKEIVMDAASLQQYAGEYQLAPAFSITVSVEGNQLMAQATGQGAAPIYAQKKDFFFYKVVDAQIEFERDEQGAIKNLVLHQNGMHLKGNKIK